MAPSHASTTRRKSSTISLTPPASTLTNLEWTSAGATLLTPSSSTTTEPLRSMAVVLVFQPAMLVRTFYLGYQILTHSQAAALLMRDRGSIIPLFKTSGD